MDRPRDELTRGAASDYVIMRVVEFDEKSGNIDRAKEIRQLIETEGLVARAAR